jgi:PTS system ascorbate-specific IIA component
MCTALFFITHEGIAHNLVAIGEAIIKKPSRNLSCYEVAMDEDINLTKKNIAEKLQQLDLKNGAIFITDIFGSTPSNIAQVFADKYNANLITGVNLAMVIRLLNYRNESEQVLIEKALAGAKNSIQNITENLD